jgi:hypothetical protein
MSANNPPRAAIDRTLALFQIDRQSGLADSQPTCTVALVLIASLVTSHDAGLSVPDRPTSYGWNMWPRP